MDDLLEILEMKVPQSLKSLIELFKMAGVSIVVSMTLYDQVTWKSFFSLAIPVFFLAFEKARWP